MSHWRSSSCSTSKILWMTDRLRLSRKVFIALSSLKKFQLGYGAPFSIFSVSIGNGLQIQLGFFFEWADLGRGISEDFQILTRNGAHSRNSNLNMEHIGTESITKLEFLECSIFDFFSLSCNKRHVDLTEKQTWI